MADYCDDSMEDDILIQASQIAEDYEFSSDVNSVAPSLSTSVEDNIFVQASQIIEAVLKEFGSTSTVAVFHR